VIIKSICPATRSRIACAPPRYGTNRKRVWEVLARRAWSEIHLAVSLSRHEEPPALRNLREGKLKLRKADSRRSVPASLRRVSRGSCEPRQSVPLHRLTPQSLRPVVQDFSQALQSRSATYPQGPQRNTRCDKSSSALTEPQQEQVLLEENHRSATATDAP
jgi:hypothetical protein